MKKRPKSIKNGHCFVTVFAHFATWVDLTTTFFLANIYTMVLFGKVNCSIRFAIHMLLSYFVTISFFKSVVSSYHSFKCEFERKKTHTAHFAFLTGWCKVWKRRSKKFIFLSTETKFLGAFHHAEFEYVFSCSTSDF